MDFITMRELVSKEEWAIIYAKLSGNKVELIGDDMDTIQRKGYENRVPTKPMTLKQIAKIENTLDMFSIEGQKEALDRNKGLIKHEKMLAEKNKENKRK